MNLSESVWSITTRYTAPDTDPTQGQTEGHTQGQMEVTFKVTPDHSTANPQVSSTAQVNLEYSFS